VRIVRNVGNADESPVRVLELRVALTVDDYEEALRFYRDGLGLEVTESWDRPDGRGAIFPVERATLEVLSKDMGETVDRIEAGDRVSGPVRLALEVEDPARAGERLMAAGAEFVGGPVVTPWGDVNVRVQAPDGMQLTLFRTP
jgi:catechol 2,3-dioxygenase-like lactoylglutathione lyase family enzyme